MSVPSTRCLRRFYARDGEYSRNSWQCSNCCAFVRKFLHSVYLPILSRKSAKRNTPVQAIQSLISQRPSRTPTAITLPRSMFILQNELDCASQSSPPEELFFDFRLDCTADEIVEGRCQTVIKGLEMQYGHSLSWRNGTSSNKLYQHLFSLRSTLFDPHFPLAKHKFERFDRT